MQALNPIFGEHPSEALKAAYKGYQGCNPEDASVIILGKDPNFDKHIANWPSFDELLYYLSYGLSSYCDKYNVVPFIHHPFLSNDYHADGYKYHNMFRRLFRDSNKDGHLTNEIDHDRYKFYSKKISFVDILGIPTYGSATIPNQKGRDATDAQKQLMRNARSTFKNLLLSRENKPHLMQLNNWLFGNSNIWDGKLILVSEGVYNLIKTYRNELFVKSDVFRIDFPSPFQDIYHDDIENITIKSSIHLSSRNATKDDFVELCKLIENRLGTYIKPQQATYTIVNEAVTEPHELDNKPASRIKNTKIGSPVSDLNFDDEDDDDFEFAKDENKRFAFTGSKPKMDQNVNNKSFFEDRLSEPKFNTPATPEEWEQYLIRKVDNLNDYQNNDASLEKQDKQLMIALIRIMNGIGLDVTKVKFVRSGQSLTITSSKGRSCKVFTNLKGMFSFTDFNTYAIGRTVVRIQRLDGDLDSSSLLEKRDDVYIGLITLADFISMLFVPAHGR